jgi:hypothetical protein
VPQKAHKAQKAQRRVEIYLAAQTRFVFCAFCDFSAFCGAA